VDQWQVASSAETKGRVERNECGITNHGQSSRDIVHEKLYFAAKQVLLGNPGSSKTKCVGKLSESSEKDFWRRTVNLTQQKNQAITMIDGIYPLAHRGN
jgi:hypothetical protein